MTERLFILEAEELLSKWGFRDGDILKDWWYEIEDESLYPNDHDVLCDLVEEYLVPAIKEAGYTIETFRIGTNHNPIRAEKLNGVEVDHGYRSDLVFDPPIFVLLSKNQIREVVERNGGNRE